MASPMILAILVQHGSAHNMSESTCNVQCLVEKKKNNPRSLTCISGIEILVIACVLSRRNAIDILHSARQ